MGSKIEGWLIRASDVIDPNTPKGTGSRAHITPTKMMVLPFFCVNFKHVLKSRAMFNCVPCNLRSLNSLLRYVFWDNNLTT
jgi:hypothetical protein